MTEAARILEDFVVKELNLDHVTSSPGVDMTKREIDGMVSTIYMDRDGEIVLPSAFEQDISFYLQNPILILSHMHKSLPVGKMIDYKIIPDVGMWAKFYITKNPIGDELLTLANERILKGFSSGFVPISFELNPPMQKIPSIALKTAMGKSPKKIYRRVELVEISLLAIPSNRTSLIGRNDWEDRANKGGKVAQLVVKAFNCKKDEDLPRVFEDWTLKVKELLVEDIELKGLLVNERKGLGDFVSKYFWEESEHPRDNSGRFSDKPDEYGDFLNKRSDDYTQQKLDKILENQNKLDKILENQEEAKNTLDNIDSKDGWLAWGQKWAFRAAAVVGAIYAFKFLRKNPTGQEMAKEAREKIKRWLVEQIAKEYQEVDDIDKFLQALSLVKDYLSKGKALGTESTEEYVRLNKFYMSMVNKLKEMTQETGLKALLSGIEIKEMTAEEFKEEEHPRSVDGRFRNKSEGAGVKNAKVEHVNEEVDHDTIPKKTEKKEESKTEVKHSDLPNSYSNEEKSSLIDWASQNKGKILAAAVSLPFVCTTVKLGGRFIHMMYNKETRSLVPFSSLTKEQKKAFLAQAEPGDVFLQGSPPAKGLISYIKKVREVLRNDPKKAKWTIQDPIGSAIENIEYPHSAMVVGHYDRTFHEKMMRAYDLVKNPEMRGKLTRDQKMEGSRVVGVIAGSIGLKVADPAKAIKELQAIEKKYLKTEKGREELWNLLNGRLLLVLGSTDPKHNGTLRMVAQGVPFGNGIGAILRTKVPLETRQNMSNKIKDAYFRNLPTNPKVQFLIDENRTPTSKENIDVILRNSFYPFFEPLKGKFSQKVLWKDDAMMCHGAVAALYEQFGGIKLGKEFRYMVANDLVRDKKFASMILEAKKKENYTKQDWAPASNLKKRHEIVTGERVVGTAAAGALVSAAADRKDKGIDVFELILKEMTAEEFKEEEHPRDMSGRFTDKPGSGETAAPEVKTEIPVKKQSWGGGREGSGRLPSNPVQARKKLEEKFKKQNPEIPQEELDKAVLDFAYENNKTDLALLITDPVEYDNQQKRRNIIANQEKKSQKDISTDSLVQETRDAKGKWDREKKKAQTITDAVKTIGDEEATQQDKIWSKTALAVGGLVTLATLLGAFRGFRKIGKLPMETRPMRPGINNLIADIDESGRPNPAEFITPVWKAVQEVVERGPHGRQRVLDTASQVYSDDVKGLISRANILLTGYLTQQGRILKSQGKRGYTAVGSVIEGYGLSSRYGTRRKFMVSDLYNYSPQITDTGRKGLKLFDQETRTKIKRGENLGSLRPNVLHIAIESNMLKETPELQRLAKLNFPKGLTEEGIEGRSFWRISDPEKFNKWVSQQKNSFLEDISKAEAKEQGKANRRAAYQAKKNQEINKIEDEAKKKKAKKAETEETAVISEKVEDLNRVSPHGTAASVHEIMTPTPPSRKSISDVEGGYRLIKENLPHVIQKRTVGEMESQQAVSNMVTTFPSWWNEKVFPLLSRKVLALLSVMAGASEAGLYYFQRDIEELASQYSAEEKKTKEQEKEILKKEERAEKTKKSEVQQEIQLRKEEGKAAQRRAEAATMKLLLEHERAQQVTKLVELGLRKEMTGATTTSTYSAETLEKLRVKKAAELKKILKKFFPESTEGNAKLESFLKDDAKGTALFVEILKKLNPDTIKEMNEWEAEAQSKKTVSQRVEEKISEEAKKVSPEELEGRKDKAI